MKEVFVMSCNCYECQQNKIQYELKKMLKLSTPKTQKAKGIMFGLEHMANRFDKSEKYRALKSMWSSVKIPNHGVITNAEQLIKYKYNKFPVFARPCPTVPRHGFVDSRVIDTHTKLKNLWKKVLDADKKGEMILGPYFKEVTHNAVYVNSGTLSVGPGNDGATGGNKSISLPVAPFKFPASFMKKAGLKKADAVYLESVMPKKSYENKWNLVQARGGPPLSSTDPDYIPANVTVKKVVKPKNDLLKWEKEVSEFKPGTVVYADGHTLASHAAIHCIINKVPFITTFKPKVGDTIKANQKKKVRISRTEFKRGVEVGIRYCKGKTHDDMRQLMLFSLSVLHNWAYVKQSDHASWILGAATIVFLKLCTALALGEYRHRSGSGKRRSRESIYKSTLNGTSSCFKKLPEVFRDFHEGNWSSGYGGIPWATCTWYTFKLWQEIAGITNKLSENLTDNEVARLIGNVNKTTNVAHNNGWWFNKFSESRALDFLAEYPGLAAFSSAEVFFDCHSQLKTVKTAKAIVKVKKPATPFVVNKEGNIRWLAISTAQNIKTRDKIHLYCFSEKEHKDAYVKIDASERKGIAAAYKKNGKSSGRRLVVPVNSQGKFKIPGSKETKSLQEVFGKSWVQL